MTPSAAFRAAQLWLPPWKQALLCPQAHTTRSSQRCLAFVDDVRCSQPSLPMARHCLTRILPPCRALGPPPPSFPPPSGPQSRPAVCCSRWFQTGAQSKAFLQAASWAQVLRARLGAGGGHGGGPALQTPGWALQVGAGGWRRCCTALRPFGCCSSGAALSQRWAQGPPGTAGSSGGGGVCSQLGMGSKQCLLLAAVGLSFDFYPLMEGRLQGESGV